MNNQDIRKLVRREMALQRFREKKMSEARAYYIEKHRISPATTDRKDVRGLLWCWEPPSNTANYIIAVDPTVGIDGWQRSLRAADDVKVDNAAIQVIRVGRIEDGKVITPDVQVAEYAAPIDYYQCAEIVNVIGRLYGGANEEGQALAIIEIYPGPGLMVQRELISTWGYQNLYQQPYLDTRVPTLRRGSPFGWVASKQSVRDLWIKGMHHINGKHIKINSPALVEEMADCEPDDSRMAMKAVFGAHDDRVRALLLGLWAAHHWGAGIEWHQTEVDGPAKAPWQASAMSYDQMYNEWESRLEEILED